MAVLVFFEKELLKIFCSITTEQKAQHMGPVQPSRAYGIPFDGHVSMGAEFSLN